MRVINVCQEKKKKNRREMSEYFRGNSEVLEWDVGQVVNWATDAKLHSVVPLLRAEEIDGKALLMLTEHDLEGQTTIGLRKNLLLAIRQLHRSSNYATLDFLGLLDLPTAQSSSNHLDHHHHDLGGGGLAGGVGGYGGNGQHYASVPGSGSGNDMDRITPPSSTVSGGNGHASLASASTKPEVFKTFVSVGK